MKSKTSFFNGTLFWNTVKRFWPMFVAYLTILIIAMPLALQSSLSWVAQNPGVGGWDSLQMQAADEVMGNLRTLTPVMTAIFGLLFVMASFSYLYNSKSVSMMCALPIKREGVLLSVAAPGLFGMLLSNVIVFLVTLAVEASFGVVLMSPLWTWLGVTTLCTLFFFGFACLCGSFTGNILVLPGVYVVLNFTVVVVEYFIRNILSGVYYGVNIYADVSLGAFSPLYRLIIQPGSFAIYNEMDQLTGFGYNLWTEVIIYGVVGIVFMVCAALLIKHRRMEAAGDVVAVNPLKPIFKYCMTLGCSLVIGVLINYILFCDVEQPVNGYTILIICMVFGAFIGYFAAEMLIQRTLKVFSGRAWTGFAVSCLVILALMLCCCFDVFGFERKLPEADEVQSVSIGGSFENVTLEDPENIREVIDLHTSLIENKNVYADYISGKAAGAHDDDKNDGSSYFDYTQLTIDYYLKNGKLLSRSYNIYLGAKTEDMDRLQEIVNCYEACINRKNLEIEVTADNIRYSTIHYFDENSKQFVEYNATPEEMEELYNSCILPDMQSGTIGLIWLDRNIASNGMYYEKAVTSCTISFELNERVGVKNYNYNYFDTTVTTQSEKTLAWLKAHGIEPILAVDNDVSEEFGGESNAEAAMDGSVMTYDF